MDQRRRNLAAHQEGALLVAADWIQRHRSSCHHLDVLVMQQTECRLHQVVQLMLLRLWVDDRQRRRNLRVVIARRVDARER